MYTSTNEECRTSINQTIEAGYKNSSGKTPSLTSKIIVKNKPSNVTVTVNQQQSNNSKKVFQVIDQSGIVGKKTITYCLNNDTSTTTSLEYEALTKQKPIFQIAENYKYNEDFDSTKSYIIFKNGCSNNIKIYIDSIDSTPLSFDISNPTNNSNLLNSQQILTFHNTIKKLNCGYHTLYIQYDNEPTEKFIKNQIKIKINPMEFKFKIFDDNNPSMVYTQSGNISWASIQIQRIDNEPKEAISISITNNRELSDPVREVSNVKKGDIIIQNIPIHVAGDYSIQVQSSDNCSLQEPTVAHIVVTPNHKQNYDYLFTRGEDGTAFDFDYLVAWEGDNVSCPLVIDSIDLKHNPNEIKICSSSTQTGLSQIGLIQLNVTNTNTEEALEGIQIELNTLSQEEDDFVVSTNEWTELGGLFNNFYNLFYEYNQDLYDNIEIQNLTADNDLIDEENVYLLIKKIEPNDTITIQLPYQSANEKTIYLQYLIYEQPQLIYPLNNCNSNNDNQPTEIEIKVADSMQTQLEITGNTDLLILDPDFSCPTECYTTKNDLDHTDKEGITYKITNIDTNDFNTTYVQTEIINSNELTPYGYYIEDEYYDIDSENANHIQWIQEKETSTKPIPEQLVYAYINFPLFEEEIIIQRTNKNGLAKFFIPIPNELNTSYTVNELLNLIYFKFPGKNDYDACILSGDNNPFAENIVKEKNTFIRHKNQYKKYHPGEIAYIPIYLYVNLEIMKNKILFSANLRDKGSSDEITILYKICNLENNEGIFKTTFQTNDDLLIPNKISKDVYCGIDTNILIDTKLEKQVINAENINVIYINVTNERKINKNVKIEIDLGKRLDQNNTYIYPGDYSFLDINIDTGDYAITQENDNIIVTWLLGEMQINQINKGIIKIKAQSIGISQINITPFDYLHEKGQEYTEVKQSNCDTCQENITYKIANSPWEEINGIWYKLINGQYYYKTLVNNELQWVKKDD